MELDEALAKARESVNPQPEPKVDEVSTANAEPDTKAVGDLEDKGGDKADVTPPTEDKTDGDQQPPADKSKGGDRPKYSKKEQARYAFAKLTSKNSQQKAQINKLLGYIEQAKGVKYDPKTMNLDEYLQLRDETTRLEGIRDRLQTEMDTPDGGLRVAQADAIWSREADVNDYKQNVLPHIAEINKVLTQKAPIVARYLRSSENAPLLEKAFIGDKGMQWLGFVNTNDSQATWDRCRQMERELLNELVGSQVSHAKEAKPSAPSARTTTSVSTAKVGGGNGSPISAPSVDAIRRLLKG